MSVTYKANKEMSIEALHAFTDSIAVSKSTYRTRGDSKVGLRRDPVFTNLASIRYPSSLFDSEISFCAHSRIFLKT